MKILEAYDTSVLRGTILRENSALLIPSYRTNGDRTIESLRFQQDWERNQHVRAKTAGYIRRNALRTFEVDTTMTCRRRCICGI